jgi:hypothetical protein
MLCKAWTVRWLVYIVKGRIFINMLYMRYLHLTKAKSIHKRQTHPLVREDVKQGLWPHRFSCTKRAWSWVSRGLTPRWSDPILASSRVRRNAVRESPSLREEITDPGREASGRVVQCVVRENRDNFTLLLWPLLVTLRWQLHVMNLSDKAMCRKCGPHTLSVPSSGWAQNEDFRFFMGEPAYITRASGKKKTFWH